MDGWATDAMRPTVRGPLGGPRWLALLAPAFLVAGLLIAFATPDPYRAGPLLSAAGPLAAVTLSVPGALVVIAVDAVLGTVLTLHHAHDPRVHQWIDHVSLGTVLAFSVLIAFVMRARESNLVEARAVADAAQRAVLPTVPGRLGPVDVAVRYATAGSAARIGGDFYAAEDTAYGVRLLLGDVRGKGLGGIGTVGRMVGTFREAAHHATTLGELVDHLDAAERRWKAAADAPEAGEWFATAVLVEVPADGGELRIVNRGHVAPLLLAPDGRVRTLEPSSASAPFGYADLVPGQPAVDVVPFPGGEILILYTDGVSEARDDTGAFFDLAAELTGRRAGDPAELLWGIGDQVVAYSGGELADDMALMAVRRTGS